MDSAKGKGKLVGSLKEAVRLSSLKDGMTVSFHHHFRDGDHVLLMAAEVFDELGLRGLKLASSSLSDVHAPLVNYIRKGVFASIETSGLRGVLGDSVSHGLMDEPVIFRSHGGRASAIKDGSLHIDLAILGASCCDALGNANGFSLDRELKSACGSLGYAIVDAKYADKVAVVTDCLVPYPNTPFAIAQYDVDYVVETDSIGDPKKIMSGATRFTTNPRDLLIAQKAAEVLFASGSFRDGFSLQTGSGGASLAVTRFIRDEMIARGFKAGYALGGITGIMSGLHEEGLIGRLLDVQSFDTEAAASLARNRLHQQIDANYYADPSGAAVDPLDAVILSALEIDLDFNVNVLTGSDGIIRGAVGGHQDTAEGAGLSILTAPLIRGRIPTVSERVNTIVTPGRCVDVFVSDRGIAVNPLRPELAERLSVAGIKLSSMEELLEKAYKLTGKPAALPWGEKTVAKVTYRDGSELDVIREIK